MVPRRLKARRSGATAVEFAITVPLMFLLFFGCLDFVRYNLLRNVITHSAYEGARSAIVPGNTTADVKEIIRRHMAPVAGAMNYKITLEPKEIPTNENQITITLEVDISSGGFVVSKFFTKNRVTETLTILNENAILLSDSD